jgi:glycosyltransferase involved in cell wall biosynthesis
MLASPEVISLILPIRGEEPSAADALRATARNFEVIVADGGCPPETVEAFSRIASQWIAMPGRTRGARLAQGARLAAGEILFFLHADSRPPVRAQELIERAVAGGAAAGSFRLAYEEATPALRWISAWANLRTRWLQLPFADQGIFCTRAAYEASGGFRDLPICDDLDFVRRLARVDRLHLLPEPCVT